MLILTVPKIYFNTHIKMLSVAPQVPNLSELDMSRQSRTDLYYYTCHFEHYVQ